MKRENALAMKAAATYIGTVIGAGFATGQEMLQFFVRFGVMGFVGLTLAAAMFIFFGFVIMDMGRRLDARSYREIIHFSGGRVLGTVIDAIITFFLFGSLTVMIAGTGALFEQQFHLAGILGNMTMALCTVVAVLSGLNGVINSMSFVVPILLISVIGISAFSLTQSPPDWLSPGQAEGGLITHWLLSAILYVSYNTVMAIAVLAPLGAKAGEQRTIKKAALMGGLGLGAASAAIFLALSGVYSKAADLEVPMLLIASALSSLGQIVFAVILFTAVYTTAVGALYGFVSRITDMEQFPRRAKLITVIATAAALLASQFGFSNFVQYLYPLVGYAGIVLLISLVVVAFKRRA
jgi:uncharacterized membrane protein YkvI